MPVQPELIGPAEIERRWRLNRTQVSRLVASGELPEPAHVVAGGRLWLAAQVEEAIEKLRSAGRLTESGTVVPKRYLPDLERV